MLEVEGEACSLEIVAAGRGPGEGQQRKAAVNHKTATMDDLLADLHSIQDACAAERSELARLREALAAATAAAESAATQAAKLRTENERLMQIVGRRHDEISEEVSWSAPLVAASLAVVARCPPHRFPAGGRCASQCSPAGVEVVVIVPAYCRRYFPQISASRAHATATQELASLQAKHLTVIEVCVLQLPRRRRQRQQVQHTDRIIAPTASVNRPEMITTESLSSPEAAVHVGM